MFRYVHRTGRDYIVEVSLFLFLCDSGYLLHRCLCLLVIALSQRKTVKDFFF